MCGRLTTVLIYVLSCVGMLAFSLTLRLYQIWIVFLFSALLGSVSLHVSTNLLVVSDRRGNSKDSYSHFI